jgi:hypothetical protein
MKKQNNYDGSIIYNELQKDIKKQKTMILVSGFSFFVLLMVIIPMAFWLFFGLLSYADLPFFDHNLTFMASNTKMFLLPYNILLIFYFVVMYYKDKKLHLVNEKHFKKSIRYFFLALGVAILPFIFTNHILLTMIYFIFFILTIYHLSFTYYDIELQKAYNIHSHLYRSEDLGWMSSHGLLDNPFTIQDDINRAKGFVQVSTLGFDFIVLFVNMIVKSMVFSYGIRYKKYIQESARLFDIILEEDLDIEYSQFSVPSKVILESLSYVSFRDGKIVLYEHGETVSQLASIKEQK